MKNITTKIITLGVLSAFSFLVSCSGDDDATNSGCTEITWYEDADGDGLGNPNVSVSDCNQPNGYVSNNNDTDDTVMTAAPIYMPQNTGNYWTYNTEATDPQTSDVTQGRDSLYVANTATINNLLYTDLDATTTSTGFMTTFFAQNFIRTDNSKLHVDGTFDLDLSTVGGSSHTIDLDDALILDSNAAVNTQLFTKSGNISDPVTISGQNYDLSIDYTVKTIQKESFATFTVDGVVYNNVIKSNIIISAEVNGEIIVLGSPVVLPIADLQDINIIENYYAENIGLIQSDSNFSIDLNPTIAAQIGIPANINAPSNQKIDTYVVN